MTLRYFIFTFAMIAFSCFVACSGTQNNGIVVDKSLVPYCLQVFDGDVSHLSELEQHPLIKKMSDGMQSQVVFQPNDYVAAITKQIPDDRFSWERFKKAQSLNSFLDLFNEGFDQDLKKLINRATEFVDVKIGRKDFKINLVCGGAWDAYVLDFGNGKEMFIDMGWFADKGSVEQKDYLYSIITHELWHVAFSKSNEVHGLPDYKKIDRSSLERLFYEIVNEGTGHYYSIHNKLYPNIRYPDFNERQNDVFELLATKYSELIRESSPEKRQKLLWASHAGVPFWEKWGAMSGALMVFHLNEVIGPKEIAKILKENPLRLLLVYDQISLKDSQLPRLPDKFILDLKEVLKQETRVHP